MPPADGRFLQGLALCVAAAVAWSVIGPLSRACFAAGMTPAELTFWRLAVSGACFIAHAGLRGELRASPRELAWFSAYGTVVVALGLYASQLSIALSGGAIAIILMFTAPPWVALFSRILFKERLTAAKLWAMALAMAGTVCVCWSGGSMQAEVSYLGLACGLLSGFLYAMQFPLVVYFKERFSTAALFAFTFTPAALVLAPFVGEFHLNAVSTGCMLVLALVSSYLAYLLYGLSLHWITPVQAAVIGNLEPVAGALLCWWFWDENFSAVGWAGCALVIGSVMILAARR
ncbi:MAG: DMT family transporter [Duodenibacillus sp.]|nr:DMT family transporter [Duodenibacillus sp.]